MAYASLQQLTVFRDALQGDDGSNLMEEWDLPGATLATVVELAKHFQEQSAYIIDLGVTVAGRREPLWTAKTGFCMDENRNFESVVEELRNGMEAYESEQKGKYVIIARFGRRSSQS